MVSATAPGEAARAARGLRLAADTGGTFTDLVLEQGETVRLYKSSTTPQDPAAGILDAVALAAA
ncbi:MAG TPA: hydantoinase/oxoprolinase N-terminal domain-containing protein, partial [Solirubrobacteraceae bacterium]